MTEEEVKQKLSIAIKERIESRIGSVDIDALAKVTSEYAKYFQVTHDLIVENYSKMLTTIHYTGKKPLVNVIILETVPKTFAKNVSEIKIQSDVSPEIVESDPVLLFIFPEMKSNDIKFIRYEIDKVVDESVLDEASTLLFVQHVREEGIPLFPITIAVLIISGVLYFFRERIIEFFNEVFSETPPKYRYKRKAKPETSATEILRRIVEKIRRHFKKEKIKIVYKHR